MLLSCRATMRVLGCFISAPCLSWDTVSSFSDLELFSEHVTKKVNLGYFDSAHGYWAPTYKWHQTCWGLCKEHNDLSNSPHPQGDHSSVEEITDVQFTNTEVVSGKWRLKAHTHSLQTQRRKWCIFSWRKLGRVNSEWVT